MSVREVTVSLTPGQQRDLRQLIKLITATNGYTKVLAVIYEYGCPTADIIGALLALECGLNAGRFDKPTAVNPLGGGWVRPRQD